MQLKKKGSVAPVPDISEKVKQYASLRSQAGLIVDQMKILAEEIKDYAEKYGTKDDKGSFYSQTNEYLFGKQAKKSVSFDKEKAIAFLKRHKFSQAIRTIEEIDNKVVESLVEQQKISFADLESITTTKTYYAINVTKLEELKDVEQHNVPLAAKKKPRRK